MNKTDLKITALGYAYELEQQNAASAVESARVIYEWLLETFEETKEVG